MHPTIARSVAGNEMMHAPGNPTAIKAQRSIGVLSGMVPCPERGLMQSITSQGCAQGAILDGNQISNGNVFKVS